ncbi:MAG: hypothetical protein AB7U20_02250 [Planctomycetaceae bacterium]
MASSDKPTAVHFTLIFFVMLSLILGVVTYLSHRDLSVAQGDLDTKTKELADANQAIANRIADLDAVKEALGTKLDEVGSAEAQGTVLGELTAQLTANGRDLQAPTVAATVIAMRTRIDQLETEIAAKEAALNAEQQQLLALQKQYQDRVGQIQTSQAGSESTLQKSIAEHDEAVRQKDDEITRLRNDYNRVQNEMAGLKDQLDLMQRNYDQQIADLEQNNTRLRTALDEYQRVSFEVPDGEIRRVDNTSRTVWINLGKDDRLREQVTFSVYDKDHHGVGRGPEDIKGRVEVVRILGPNLSQARILEEDLFRPMAEGDVVYTPVWSAGLIERFAFTGEIDFDQDGQSDRDQLHNMLHHAGAEISVEVTDEGYRFPENGALTQDTKFLVRGYIPDASQYASADLNRERIERMQKEQTELTESAQHQGIRILSLNDFLSFMGYRPTQRLFLPGENMPYTLQGGARSTDTGGPLDPTYSSGQTSELFRRKEDYSGKPIPPGTRKYGN